MPRKKKDQEYQDWVKTVKYCRSSRQGMTTAWKRWYNMMDDNLFTRRMPDGSKPIEVNEMNAIVQNIIPAIALDQGIVEVRSISADDLDMAQAFIWEGVGRYIVKQYNLHEPLVKTIFDALVLGDGLIKIGYYLFPMVGEAQWRAGLASENAVAPYSVFGLNTPMFEFYPDYYASDWRRMRYYVHEYTKHMDELKDNPALDQKVVNKLKPNSGVLSYLKNMVFAFDDKDKPPEDYVTIQEIHSFPEGEVFILAEDAGVEEFLYKGPEQFPMLPFERLSFFPRPLKLWGKGITQSIEGHILDLSKLHNYAMNVAKKQSLIKLLLNSAVWKPEEIKRLERGVDTTHGLPGDPRDSYEIIDYGATGTNFMFEQLMERKRRIIRDQSGVSQVQMGTPEPGIDTATEASILKGQGDLRNLWRAKMFSMFASRVLEKMFYVISVTYEPERIAAMAGLPVPMVVPLIEAYNPSKFLVEYGHTAAISRTERLQKLQILASLAGPALNPAVFLKLLTEVLGFEFSDALLVQGQMLSGGSPQQGNQAAPGTPGARPAESDDQMMANMSRG